MTLSEAYLALGRAITDLSNSGKIDGSPALFFGRAEQARALLRAAMSLSLESQDRAIALGKALSTPITEGPAAGKDWRPVAELAWKLGRQVAREGQDLGAQVAA